MTAGLSVEHLTLRRGELTICTDISLTVPPGEITVLLGANGAGKSTLLDGIAGVITPAAGTVTLGGRRIDRLPVYKRAALGLGYVEEGRSVFAELTVAENISVVDRSRSALTDTFDLFPQLVARRDTRAGLLSGGEQQMLVIARAITARPRLLLIDELSLGLAPRMVSLLMESLTELTRRGVGVLLVEQFVEAALRIGSTAHVMQRGRIVRAESCSVLLQDHQALATPYLSAAVPELNAEQD